LAVQLQRVCHDILPWLISFSLDGYAHAAMKLRHVYLLLCVVGFVLPYWEFVPWVASHGISLSLLVRELFATRIGAFFGMDVLISAIAVVVFASVEGRRLKIRSRWIVIVALLLVGVSLALPLFLYLRERHVDSTAI
jgi:hypothetical protein